MYLRIYCLMNVTVLSYGTIMGLLLNGNYNLNKCGTNPLFVNTL